MAPRADSLKEYSRLKGEQLIRVKTLSPIPKEANPDALRVKIGDELIQVCASLQPLVNIAEINLPHALRLAILQSKGCPLGKLSGFCERSGRTVHTKSCNMAKLIPNSILGAHQH